MNLCLEFVFKSSVKMIWHVKTCGSCLYSRVVKEEIVDDDAHLPCFNGRVVSWVRLLLYLNCIFKIWSNTNNK